MADNVDPMNEAERLKQLGNEKLKQEQFSDAVDYFTKAINFNKENHIYFSNRCAALMYLKNYNQALEDAETCIKLSPQWGKGWARKAAALEALDKMDEAKAAYAKAKELGHVAVDNSPPMWTALVQFVLFLGRLFLLACLIVYPFDTRAYTWCLLCAIPVLATQMFLHVGLPKLTQEYGEKIMFSYRLHYIVLAGTFLVAKPFFLGLVPIVLSEMGFLAEYIDANLRGRLVESLLDPIVDFVMPLAASVAPGEWTTMCTSGKWQTYNTCASNLCAAFEVCIVLVFILDLFTAQRNILVLILYLQFLRVRYLLSSPVRQVFQRIDTRVRSAFSGIPVIDGGYNKLSNAIASMVALPLPGQTRTPLSRCTIM